MRVSLDHAYKVLVGTRLVALVVIVCELKNTDWPFSLSPETSMSKAKAFCTCSCHSKATGWEDLP